MYEFPIPKNSQDAARDLVEQVKADLNFNARMVETILTRLYHYSVVDEHNEKQVRSVVERFVVNEINKMIQEVVISSSLERSHETMYLRPPANRKKRTKNRPALLEEMSNRDSDLSETASSIPVRIFGNRDQTLVKFKAVCIRNAVRHVSDIDFEILLARSKQ